MVRSRTAVTVGHYLRHFGEWSQRSRDAVWAVIASFMGHCDCVRGITVAGAVQDHLSLAEATRDAPHANSLWRVGGRKLSQLERMGLRLISFKPQAAGRRTAAWGYSLLCESDPTWHGLMIRRQAGSERNSNQHIGAEAEAGSVTPRNTGEGSGPTRGSDTSTHGNFPATQWYEEDSDVGQVEATEPHTNRRSRSSRRRARPARLGALALALARAAPRAAAVLAVPTANAWNGQHGPIGGGCPIDYASSAGTGHGFQYSWTGHLFDGTKGFEGEGPEDLLRCVTVNPTSWGQRRDDLLGLKGHVLLVQET